MTYIYTVFSYNLYIGFCLFIHACSCDSWIYSLMMHVIIIGSLVPLHIHLQKNNDYFNCVRFIMGMQVMFFVAEIGRFKERCQGRAMGSISHMLGIVAIILHLRLISPALAMGVGIPLSLWSFITIFYQCVALSCENILI